MLGSDFDFPEDDFDDDLDPALMEELDRFVLISFLINFTCLMKILIGHVFYHMMSFMCREVEEFARRLNSVCPERV